MWEEDGDRLVVSRTGGSVCGENNTIAKQHKGFGGFRYNKEQTVGENCCLLLEWLEKQIRLYSIQQQNKDMDTQRFSGSISEGVKLLELH